MYTFEHFLLEQQAEQQSGSLISALKALNPAKVIGTLRQFGAQSVDDLIQKLAASPIVKQVQAVCQQASQKVHRECIELDEGIMSSIMSGLGGLLMKLVKGVLGMIGKVLYQFFIKTPAIVAAPLNPFSKEHHGGQMKYASALLLTFLLGPFLLAIGAPMAAVTSGFVPGWMAMWWFLAWFGWNVLSPALQAVEMA